MRVVIVGMGKSGTTALLFAVRSAMPPDTVVLFEPPAFVPVTAANAVAKVLLHPKRPMDAAFYRQFDRVVLIVRDPRDVLVSRALYRVYGAGRMIAGGGLDDYLALLRAKERDPRSVSMLRINAAFETMGGSAAHTDAGRTRMLDDAMAFHDAFPNALVYKYEDMVEGRFGDVARFLNLDEARMNPQVPDALARVDRSRRSGNWRSWFCPEDVLHYRAPLARYMTRYGYDDDWPLDAKPHIRPEECSEYVLRLVRERQTGAPAARPT